MNTQTLSPAKQLRQKIAQQQKPETPLAHPAWWTPVSSDPCAVIIEITPALAEHWLRYNTSNRHLRLNAVETIAMDILDGKWQLNGATIVFAKDGTLLTGQHRLHAIVLAEATIPSFVVFGIERDTFSTQDDGMKKTGSDILGIAEITNTTLKSGAARWVRAYGERAENSVSLPYAKAMPSHRVLEFVGRHPMLSEICDYVCSRKPKTIFSSPSIGMMVVAAEKYGKEKVFAFIDKAISGEGLVAGTGVYHYRERLLHQNPHMKMPPQMIARLAARCINLHINDKKLAKFPLSPDSPFPVI